MFRLRAILRSLILLAACCASFAGGAPRYQGIGSTEVLLAKYQSFKQERARAGESASLRVPLGYVKGLSRSFTAAAGEVAIDLDSGGYVASLRGLAPTGSYSLWLVDGHEPGDAAGATGEDARVVKLGDLEAGRARIAGRLPEVFPDGFTVDRINVLEGAGPRGAVVASGGVNVFQKLFFRRLDASGPASRLAPTRSGDPEPRFSQLIPDLTTQAVSLDALITNGATLFFAGTFDGNGRTCGTCHPKSNNFTIDVPFIASLPPTDPLFVAEFTPALAQLEKPALMRQFGLILENLDGLDDPVNKFVMRSVPHTLGMQVSLARDLAQPSPPVQMTGWAGDGAPGAGALRDFATGAVTQHFTRTLARVAGTDFKLPTEGQLDAMEAFQLSLGRPADFDLDALVFSDLSVEAGKLIFRDGTGDAAAAGRCAGCHANGGALAANLQNLVLNTNVEDGVNPARAVQSFPVDGGFGLTANADGSFGNRAFNTPPIVEAADTAPFFHNNIAATLEEVVAFYASPLFNGPREAAARFAFTAVQSAQLVEFMRAINALQNIQIARGPLQELMDYNGNSKQVLDPRLETAAFETADAIAVLTDGSIYPGVIPGLTTAQQKIAQARVTNNKPANRALVQAAIDQLDAARAAIAP